MKRTRSYSAGRGEGSAPRLDVAVAEIKRPQPSRTGVSICQTCLKKVDWKDEGGRWTPYNHGTEVPHRCRA